MRTLLLLFSLLLMTASIYAQQLELKSYFFPYKNLFKAQVYKYVNEDNPNDIIYQYTQSHISQGDTVLVLRRYDHFFQELETMTQVISDTGVSLQHYSLYIAGEGIVSKVLQSQVYQWRQAQREHIKWTVRYQSPYGDEGFRKERSVTRALSPYRFRNVAYKTVQFRDDFRHSVKGQKGIRTTDFHQYSRYAQGLGLVAYDRTLPTGPKMRYRLEKIMDLKAWKKLQESPYKPVLSIRRT